ncbi:glycosyltransferase [Microbacterium indicum]|uniref:glycosyltransferase n=1 Tax=Microbacterium indicum TaxID=358100 RepID=UPI00041CE5CB|nr:glycosyltransferase [Microbacterium indicum]
MPELTVAHVAHTTAKSGAELALARVLRSEARAWDATLLVPEGAPDGAFEGLPLVRAGRAQRPGASTAGPLGALSFGAGILAQARALRAHPAFAGVDVIHANSTRAAVYAALAAKRTPLVVHLRDRVDPDALGRAGFEAFRRVAIPRAAGFIANSRSTAETLRPFTRRGQFVEVIPSPLGMGRGSARAPHDGPVRIGMVARLDPWKGQDLLIRAFAGLEDRAELRLVGDAPFGHDAYRAELAALGPATDFRGFRDDVAAEIDALDIGVQFSTRPEPLGQNVLQYLARGAAVVAANAGGPTEWIRDGENGLLVEPNDVAALAAALRRLVDDEPLRARLQRAALATPGIPTDDEVTRAHARAFQRAVR